MSEYKKLTKRRKDGTVDVTFRSDYPNVIAYKLKNRLAELEDKIENGTLVELPCKVGDVMYEVIEDIPIQEWKIESICFDKAYPKGVIWAERTRDFAHWKFWIEDCGTKWFATKAEAEAKLKELQEKQK